MSETEKIVWDGESAGAISAYKALVQADRELLAQIQRTLQTAERGSKEWQQAKLKEMQVLRQVANDTKNLEKAQESLGKQTKTTGDAFSKAFGAAQAVIGAMGLKQLLDDLIAYRKELAAIESAHKKAFAPLEQAAALRSPGMQRDVGKEAIRAGVTVEQAASTAAGLMREGVSKQDATGEVLREALTAQQVLGREGGEQIVGMLDAQKIDLTAANIRGVAEALDGLRIAGAVSDKDLAGFVGEVAKSGAVFQRAGLDVKEQFAVSAALKDRGVEGAGAGLESMIGKLSKAGDDKAAQEALATIGLTTEDVTLSKDQDLIQVMAKLDKALSTQAAPGDRGAILADIVGKQGFGVGETLMEEIRAGTVGKLMDAQRGEYSASAERAMSSEATVLQRLQTQADVAKAEKGQGAEVIRKALETVLAEQGVIGPQAQLALKAFDTGTGFASPEQAIQSAALTLPQNLFNQGESLKKRVIDKARAARRPDTLGQVGDSDLTSDVSSAVSEYSGPSLSERKAQEEQGDAELDRLKLELEDLELQKEKQESAGKPQSKLHGGSELDKRIKAKKLQISEQDNRIKHSKLEGRAAGGPVAAGEPYIVGEKGPELFLPGQGGEILSNPNLTDLLARSEQFKQQQDAMRAASKEWAAGWLDRHIERMGSDREYAAGIRQGIHDDKVAANRAKLGIDHEGAERRFKASMVNMSRHSSAGGRRPAAARGPKGKPGDAAAPGGQFGPTASQSAGSGSYTHANLEGGGAMAAQMADLLNVNRQILLVLRNMQQRGIQRNAQMS